jgi:antibiotic biosynthesis monooxygenase (ABM) superfamily enzyme
LHSKQRLALVEENKEFEASTRIQVIGSTFPGWEPTISGKPVTPAWKTACLVVLGLYPILVIQRHYLVPLLNGLNMALAIAITSLCSVGLVSLICMPVFGQEVYLVAIAGCHRTGTNGQVREKRHHYCAVNFST